MTTFDPPIETRETDELITISKSNTDDWQQEAIDIAKNELIKRGINWDQIDLRHKELEKKIKDETEQELKIRAEEDFSVFEKIYFVLFWMVETRYNSNWNLRSEGYILKAKHRLQLMGLGIVIYAVFFMILYLIYR